MIYVSKSKTPEEFRAEVVAFIRGVVAGEQDRAWINTTKREIATMNGRISALNYVANYIEAIQFEGRQE